MSKYVADEIFDGEDWSESNLPFLEFDNCIFKNCLMNKADLSNCKFVDCSFIDVDMSSAVVVDTSFRDIIFKNCKLLGVFFEDCNPLLMSFEMSSCILNYSSFNGVKLNKCSFAKCDFVQSLFNNTDFRGSVMKECNFLNAEFRNADLRKLDLTTCCNVVLNLNENNLSGCTFSRSEIDGLLSPFGIVIDD